ncbi:lamin tail domain-containing protein [candidate division WOR-3 bacterium]|nr:lamin tail domain-containing protein [candidate division WOR-3 bacterium]
MKNSFAAISFFITEFVFATQGEFSILPMAASDSTPFVIKVTAFGLEPDSIYRFGVYVYGGYPSPGAISQRWADEDWKGGYAYTDFTPYETGNWCGWAPLRIVKKPLEEYNYYIKFKVKKETTDIFESAVHLSEGFQIINMNSEGGWLAGIVFRDLTLTTPYPNVNILAKNSENHIVGAYVTENNGIDEENSNIPGYFCIAVPNGHINSLEFQDMEGNPIAGYTGISSPWEITPGETTWVDPFLIKDLTFTPENPQPGNSVMVNITLYNPAKVIHNMEVIATYEKNQESSEIGTVMLDSLPAYSYSSVKIAWHHLKKGNYKIKVLAKTDEFNIERINYLRIGEPLGDIVFNEIMYKPTNSGEWIEIINRCLNTINIKNWTIEDTKTKCPIASEDYFIEPYNLATIAESTSEVLSSIYSYSPGTVFCLGSKFPSLNNEGDTIIIKDKDGEIQDIIRYKDSWGNKEKGVSLERINPNIYTNISANWGSCVTASGGTPGNTNSIYAEHTPEKVILSVSPKVFSPETLGADKAVISYTLPFTKAYVRLYIYDRCGRCVRKLVDNSPSGASSEQIWDGYNDKGNLSPIGVYIVYLEAKDQTSEKLINKKATVILAKRLSK